MPNKEYYQKHRTKLLAQVKAYRATHPYVHNPDYKPSTQPTTRQWREIVAARRAGASISSLAREYHFRGVTISKGLTDRGYPNPMADHCQRIKSDPIYREQAAETKRQQRLAGKRRYWKGAYADPERLAHSQERRRKNMAKPENLKKQVIRVKAYRKKRRAEDPVFRKKENRVNTVNIKKRIKRDPVARKKRNARARDNRRRRFLRNADYPTVVRLRQAQGLAIYHLDAKPSVIKLFGATGQGMRDFMMKDYPNQTWEELRGASFERHHIEPLFFIDVKDDASVKRIMSYKNLQLIPRAINNAIGERPIRYNIKTKDYSVLLPSGKFTRPLTWEQALALTEVRPAQKAA